MTTATTRNMKGKRIKMLFNAFPLHTVNRFLFYTYKTFINVEKVKNIMIFSSLFDRFLSNSLQIRLLFILQNCPTTPSQENKYCTILNIYMTILNIYMMHRKSIFQIYRVFLLIDFFFLSVKQVSQPF